MLWRVFSKYLENIPSSRAFSANHWAFFVMLTKKIHTMPMSPISEEGNLAEFTIHATPKTYLGSEYRSAHKIVNFSTQNVQQVLFAIKHFNPPTFHSHTWSILSEPKKSPQLRHPPSLRYVAALFIYFFQHSQNFSLPKTTTTNPSDSPYRKPWSIYRNITKSTKPKIINK